MKRSFVTRIAAVVVLMAILLCVPTRASAYPVSYELNFPTVRQEKSLWCWAACCCAVIEYYGGNVSQSSFVRTLRGNEYNQGGTILDMQQGLLNYSISSTLVESALTLVQIRLSTYSNRRPVLAAIAWAGGGGHALAVIGYIDNAALGDKVVIYMDPYYEEIFTAEYSEFVNSDRQFWFASLTNVQ